MDAPIQATGGKFSFNATAFVWTAFGIGLMLLFISLFIKIRLRDNSGNIQGSLAPTLAFPKM